MSSNPLPPDPHAGSDLPHAPALTEEEAIKALERDIFKGPPGHGMTAAFRRVMEEFGLTIGLQGIPVEESGMSPYEVNLAPPGEAGLDLPQAPARTREDVVKEMLKGPSGHGRTSAFRQAATVAGAFLHEDLGLSPVETPADSPCEVNLEASGEAGVDLPHAPVAMGYLDIIDEAIAHDIRNGIPPVHKEIKSVVFFTDTFDVPPSRETWEGLPRGEDQAEIPAAGGSEASHGMGVDLPHAPAESLEVNLSGFFLDIGSGGSISDEDIKAFEKEAQVLKGEGIEVSIPGGLLGQPGASLKTSVEFSVPLAGISGQAVLDALHRKREEKAAAAGVSPVAPKTP
jgi:hypothetical protein